MDLRLTDEQQLLRRTIREFAEAEIRPHVMEWDEAQAFPQDARLEAGGAWPDGHSGAGDVRRRRDDGAIAYCICLEELARVDPSICPVGGRAQRTGGRAPADVRQRGAEAAVPRAACRRQQAGRAGRSPRRARGATRPRCARRRARRRRLGPERDQAVHHPRRHRRHAGRHGGDRSPAGQPRHFGVHRAQGHAGLSAGKKENKLGMRASDTSEVILDGLPRAGLGHHRRARRRIPPGDAGARCRPHRHRRAGGWAGSRARTSAARRYALERRQFGQRDLGVPGDPLEDCRHGDAHPGGAAADLPRRLDARSARSNAPHWRRRSPSCTPAKSPCAPPRSACRSMAAMDFVKDYPAEKFFRDVKLCTIGEGTSEIQRLVIGRQLTRTLIVALPPLADRLLGARPSRDRARDFPDRRRSARGRALIGRIFGHTGRAYLIGVTGPPGAGKSTLVDRLTAEIRKGGRTVGVLVRRSHEPVQRRRNSWRSRAHAGACRRRGRVHPQHGHARPSRRPRAHDRRSRDRPRRGGLRRHHHRDRRRRAGRSGHRPHGGCVDRHARARRPATKCRRSRPASWKSPTSSS